VHCYARNEKYGKYCTYSLWRMGYLKYRMGKIPVRREVYKMVKGNAYGNFKDLSTSRRDVIAKLSTDGKFDILNKNEIYQKGLLTMKDIAARMSVTKVYVSRLMNKMKIKPEKIYKRINYFNKNVIDILNER